MYPFAIFLIIAGGISAVIVWQIRVNGPRCKDERNRLIQNMCRNFELNDRVKRVRRSSESDALVTVETARPAPIGQTIASQKKFETSKFEESVKEYFGGIDVVLPQDIGASKLDGVGRAGCRNDRNGKSIISDAKQPKTKRPPPLKLDRAKIDAILCDAEVGNLESEEPNRAVERNAMLTRPVPGSISAAARSQSQPPRMNQPAIKLNHAKIDLIKRESDAAAAIIADAMDFGTNEPSCAIEPNISPKRAFPESTATTIGSRGSVVDSSAIEPAVRASPPPQQPLPAPPTARVVETTDPSLPARYAAFYQALLSRGQCTIGEAEQLARQHGHMLSGALEALNEWSTEKLGGSLFFEDGNQLVLERERLN
jgi:hypothetical protein